MILTVLGLILIVQVTLIALWFIWRVVGTPHAHGLQKELDLRLTYKRYLQIYPSANITYEDYKRMQVAHAYKKAVSSTKIKRMVR